MQAYLFNFHSRFSDSIVVVLKLIVWKMTNHIEISQILLSESEYYL